MLESVTGAVGRHSPDVDVAAAVAGLVLALILFPLRFFTTQVFVQAVPPLLALGCLVYLFARRRDAASDAAGVAFLSPAAGRVTAGVAFAAIGGLAAVAVRTGGRTVPFLLGAGAVGSLLLAQILFVDRDGLRPGLLLAQIVLFSLVVRFGALLTTPGLIGVDSWSHLADYAASMRAADSIGAMGDVKYVTAPLYHVFVVAAADALGVSLRAATYATLGVVVPLASLFVYAAGRFFLPRRWALFGVALFAFGDHVVRWGVHVIPTSLGLVFVLAAVYALTRASYATERTPVYALLVLFSAATVLTHQLSAFVLLVIFGAGVLADLVSRASSLEFDDAVSVNVPAVFAVHAVFMLVNWAMTPYGEGSFLTEVPRGLARAMAGSAGFLNLASESGATASGIEIPQTIAVVDAMGFFLLLFLVVVGCLALLRRAASEGPMLLYLAATVVLAFVTLGLPLFGISSFLPGRWYAFMYVPMALVAAVGCWLAVQRLPRRTVTVGLVLFILLFPGTMLVANKATPDDPVFEEYHTRYSYSEAELAAVETLGDTRPVEAAPIFTDHPYRTVFTRTGAWRANVLVLESGEVSHDVAVYRRYQSEGAPVVMAGETPVKRRVSAEQVCGPGTDRAYVNADVAMCTSGSGA